MSTLDGDLHMKSITPLPAATSRPFEFHHDKIWLDYRQLRASEERARVERKQADVAEQSSTVNSVDLRIRAWEKVHQLSMPSALGHPVLHAIAVATQLTLAEVEHAQRLRCLRHASTG
jgi:hypothetical protein